MGLCGFSTKHLILFIIICFAIAYLPGIPPHMEFTPYDVTPALDLEGNLAINEKLNGAQHLFVGQIKNPESFAVANKTVYTGVEGGKIVKIVGDQLITVANLVHPCIDSWDERNCGRLLGMQFDKHGMLYVADAYYGIYKVNVNTGKSVHLIATAKPIEGKIASIANSVAVTEDASTIYWTTSSCDVNFDHAVIAMAGDATGRLFKYDPIKKTNTLLLDKIHFANGIALSSKEDFIIIAETVRSRLIRYWLSGSKKGKSEIFVDGLPGMPDNIRSNGRNGFYVTLVLPRTKSMPAISDLMGPYPALRRFLARVLHLIEMPFENIHRTYPNIYTGIITHWIANLELLTPTFPKGCIVVEVNESGEIIGSLHSTDKRVTSVSDMVIVDNFIYLGSPFNNFLGRVRIQQNSANA